MKTNNQVAIVFGGADVGNSPVTMTSIELVEFINNHRKQQADDAGQPFPSKGFAKLEHRNFLAKVPKVLGAETSAKFLADLPDGYGRLQSAYRFPKREACLMAMSYSYALQAAVFDHMTALEAKVAAPDLATDEGKLLLIQDLAAKQLALLTDNKRIQQERDHAIATKAQIGSKREATAMATAATKAREANQLKHELGFSSRHATILQVEKKLKREFAYVPMRRWCNQNQIKAETVPDKRYPDGVKAWPAAAWMAVYSVDLAQLFGEAA